MSKDSKIKSIPLVCILCPGNKKFSDLSHLLTHLNSKGHLQNKHKLELRAGSDRTSQSTLDRFAEWYKNNNFGELLSARMNPKDKKTGGKDSKSKKLGIKKIKHEVDMEDEEMISKCDNFRAPMPRMQPNAISDDGTWEQPKYDTPRLTRRLSSFEREASGDNTSVDPALEYPWRESRGISNDIANDGKIKGGPLILKGERFDGMDVFDAATPRAKRKRNQRKGPQVLKQMMKNSAEVEPAEISYHPSGEFRASRSIYGPVSEDGSPDGRKIPSPKKRKSSRIVLRDKPVNIPRPKTARSQKQIASRSPAKLSAPALERDYGSFAFLNYNTNFNALGANKTVNPFKLAVQVNSKPEQINDDDHDFQLMSDALTKQIRESLFELDHNQVHIQPDIFRNTGFASFCPTESRGKTGLWENPLNLNFVHLDNRSPLQQPLFSNHGLPNYGSHLTDFIPATGSPTPISKSFTIWKAENDQSNQIQSSNTPKGLPKVGFFKTQTCHPEFQSPQVNPLSNNRNPLISAKILSIDELESGEIEPQPCSIGYGPTFSPNMTDRSHQNQTSVTKSWSIEAAEHRGGGLAPGYNDDEALVTPRNSFRQPTSSALRSTARSSRPSARLPNLATRPHYGSDLESELFDWDETRIINDFHLIHNILQNSSAS